MLELIHYLEQIDTTILLFFNGMHNELFDYFMVLVSNRFTWVPFYAAFIFVMIKNFHWKVTIFTILAVALLVLLCDQTASGLLKPLVGRLRPSNLDNSISYMVHVVDGYRGGRYGFPSSHSANSWGVAIFAMYLVRNRKLNIFLAFWAALVTYSRAYLGVHYPGDLLVGVLIGFVMASIVFYAYNRWARSYTQEFQNGKKNIQYDYLPISVGLISIAAMFATSLIMFFTS